MSCSAKSATASRFDAMFASLLFAHANPRYYAGNSILPIAECGVRWLDSGLHEPSGSKPLLSFCQRAPPATDKSFSNFGKRAERASEGPIPHRRQDKQLELRQAAAPSSASLVKTACQESAGSATLRGMASAARG